MSLPARIRHFLPRTIVLSVLLSAVAAVAPAHALFWSENGYNGFKDGVLYRTTVTADNGVLRLSSWNDWYDVAWSSRAAIVINNGGSDNTLTNYQIDLTVNTQQYIQSGNMRPDMKDIRISDEDGKTMLPYYIATGSGTATRIVVKVPKIAARTSKTIYLYFKNPSMNTSLSSPSTVYDLYETWESGNIGGQWLRGGSFVNPADQHLFEVVSSSKYQGSYSVRTGSNTHSETSYLSCIINLDMTAKVTFYWATSSEPIYDKIQFYIDDVYQGASISGETNWQAVSRDVPAGNHTLKWEYSRDSGGGRGLNVGWIDNIVVNKYSPAPPTVTSGSVESRADYYYQGVYGSKVLDAGGEGAWVERITWTYEGNGGLLTCKMRSSDTAFTADSPYPDWSGFAQVESGGPVPSNVKGRYLQYQFSFSANGTTTPYLLGTSVYYHSPPIRPSNFTATVLSSTTIHWTWKDNSTGELQEDGVTVFCSTGGIRQLLPRDTTEWYETGLEPNTIYSRYLGYYNAVGTNTIAALSPCTLSAPPQVAAEDYTETLTDYSYTPIPVNTELFRSSFSFTSAKDTSTIEYYIVAFSTEGTHTFSEKDIYWLPESSSVIHRQTGVPILKKPQILMTAPINSTSWYFHAEAYNKSGVSNGAVRLGPFDFEGAPAAITDLTAVMSTGQEGAIVLTWTAPSEDGSRVRNLTSGSFVIRGRKDYLITNDAQFDAADYQVTVATSVTAGQKITYVVSGLAPGSIWGFAVKSIDADGNISPLSGNNISIANTRCPASKVNRIVFLSAPFTNYVGLTSPQITVQCRDASGNPMKVAANTNIYFRSTSNSPEFSANVVPWVNTSFVNIAAGNAEASFYYKDIETGNQTITVEDRTGLGWTAGQQVVAVLPGKAVRFMATTPTTQYVGVPADITVRANDGYNTANTSNDFWGTVAATSTLPGSLLEPATHYFDGTNGSVTFKWKNVQQYAGTGYVSVQEVLSQDYTGLVFSGNNIGYLAANGGIVKKTGDLGANWFALKYSSGTENMLSAIGADNSGNAVIAASGNSDAVAVSTDAAQHWRTASTGLGVSLRGVFVVNTATAYVCGEDGKVAKSVDGGLNWTAAGAVGLSDINAVWFISASTGFVASANGALYKTDDAGATWTPISLPGAPATALNQIRFVDESTGFIAGDAGAVFRTDDGGATWVSRKPTADVTAASLKAVSFINSMAGFAVGDNRTIIKTVNGGLTWTKAIEPGGYDLSAVSFAGSDAHTIIAAGKEGTIYRSTDDGDHWTAVVMQGVTAPVQWNGLLVNVDRASMNLAQGSAGQPTLKITAKTAFGGTAYINGFNVKLAGGTGSNTDISAVKFYRDNNNNGFFDPADVKLGGNSVINGAGNASISGFSSTIVNEATYFMVLDMSQTADLTKTIGFVLDTNCLATYGTINLAFNGLPRAVDPFDIIPSSVALRVNMSDCSPVEVKQGNRGVLISTFTLITDRSRTPWRRLTVARSGVNNIDSDIECLKLYRSGSSDPDDAPVLISSAVFGSITPGAAYMNIANQEIDNVTTNYYFLRADISPTAVYYTEANDAKFWLSVQMTTGYFLLDDSGRNTVEGLNGSTFLTKQIRIQQAYNTLVVKPLTAQPAFDIDQSQTKLIMPLKMYMTEDGARADLLKMTAVQTGTAEDADIQSIRLYRDMNGNGVFNEGDDLLVGSSALSEGTAEIVFPTPVTITTDMQYFATYFMTVSVTKLAVPEHQIVLQVSSSAYTLAGVNKVDPSSGFSTPAATIKNYRDTVSVTIASLIPSEARVDETGVGVSRITMCAYCSARLTQLTLEQTGNAAIGDVLLAKIYRDHDQNGVFSATQDVLLGTATFGSDGKGLVTFGAPPVVYDSSYTMFVVYDINPAATPGRTLGVGIADSAFVFPGEAGASHFGYYRSPLTTLLRRETPTVPQVSLGIANPAGRTINNHTIYYVNEPSGIGFTWDSTASNGLSKALFAVASYQVSSSTETPDLTPWSETAVHAATMKSMNLRHSETYYLWVKAVSTDGFERVTSLQMKVDLTPPPAPAKPSDSSRTAASSPLRRAVSDSSYWISWNAVTDPESDIMYYEVQERTNTSALWLTISTTTVTDLQITKNPQTDSGKFFYYRIRARNYAGSWGGYSPESAAAYLSLPGELIDDLGSYPNPFDSRKRNATITFVLNQNATVAFKIFDLFGSLVKEWETPCTTGENHIEWDGADADGQKVGTGMYILAVEAKTGDTTVKKRWKIGVVH